MYKQLISLGVLSLHLFPLGCSIALGKNGKLSTQLIQLLIKMVFLKNEEMYFLPVGGHAVAGSRREIISPRNVNESGLGAI